ncbi:MAG: hypothetical protein QOH73_855, partial [Gaiellaceae bacterium]|nr:hypothetical protein [Gaiellaceae bacterium]
TSVLDSAALDEVFDINAYTRHIDVVFDRLRALIGKGEPVHV